MEFRTLRANEIDCRIAQIEESWLSLLLYKDARVDMNILDETVGCMNWKKSYTRDNANCVVSIYDQDKKEWVGKEDTGTESFSEAEKGLASDSFKRACFNWGIGRELYTAPNIYINPIEDSEFYIYKKDKNTNKEKYTTKTKFYVDCIEYDKNKNIVGLIIKDNKGIVRYRKSIDKDKKGFYENTKVVKEQNESEIELSLIYMSKMNDLVLETDTDMEELLNYFEVKSNKDMNLQQLKLAVAILEKKKMKNKEEVF